MVKTGLDLLHENLSYFRNKRIGLIMNQASVDSHLQSAFNVFLENGLNVFTLFGPQHGLFGHTQDNMVEWNGGEYGLENIKVFSLYGNHRKPTPAMLEDLDVLVFDVPDIGSRYYTFIWTLALCMEAAAETKTEFVVLDRPNPLNGLDIEGPILDMDFRSFVGLYPLSVRHGMTIAEISKWLQFKYFTDLDLHIISMQGWQRNMWFDETDLPWVMPSPNMPHLKTAIVYPGQCLLEATNLSEGRGTTRPFEIFGAPWLDAELLCSFLNRECDGADFQPWYFQPTFHKYAGELCRGAFIHVTDRNSYKPLATTMTSLSFIKENYPDHFKFKDPPYEYEYEKNPFDILMGNAKWRTELDKKYSYSKWPDQWQSDLEYWQKERQDFLLY